MVRLEDAERMNLLGLLLQGFLSQQLTDPKLQKRARRLRGQFGVQVADMAVTLGFSPEGVLIRKGMVRPLRATVRGPMKEMIPLVTGGGLVVAAIAVLEGRISIGGNPFALLRLMPLLMASGKKNAALPAQGTPS
jgi:hypothetical protein